ncbi:MAG TPA: sodium:proton exchanger [Acidimicrobiia bacterium]|nr:sodium:proton exchanger [Acidimicrobiia bacterium]
METPRLNRNRQILLIAAALIATLPGVLLRLTGTHPDPILAAFLFGLAIVGAAFVLSWAAEVVQLDIAAGLALALLALIAILPEYAVDFVFTAKAGREFADTGQASQYGPLALANMTGGNQLLIGLGWPLVILIGTWRVRKAGVGPELAEGTSPNAIHLTRAQSVDIAYLTIASIYGLSLFLKETLTPVDAVVLVGIYVLYLIRLSGAPPSPPHLVGPSAYIGSLPRRTRRMINYAGFVVAAGVILLCAEPFAESIIELGEAIGVSEFLLVKWIAPTASEAPELLVATLFAWRLASRTGLGALISSKVNQWTLLVGTLPIVFSIFAGMVHGLPLDRVQRVELFVTAAQSVFAVGIVASRSVTRGEAWVMLGLFIAQLVESGLAELGHLTELMSTNARIGVGIVFLMAAAWVLRRDFRALLENVKDGLRAPWEELAEKEPV